MKILEKPGSATYAKKFKQPTLSIEPLISDLIGQF